MGEFFGLLKKSGQDFLRDDCMSSGAAIAYYTIFSLPPLLAIAFMIATAVGFREEQVTRVIKQEVGLPVAGNAAEGEGPQVPGAQQAAEGVELPMGMGSLGPVSKIFGLLVLMFSATGVFGQLQHSLNKAWEVQPDPEQGGVWQFVSKRLLSAGLILVIGFLLLVSLILTTVLDQVLHWVLGGSSGSQVIGLVINEVIAFAVATVLFAAMFKYLPDAIIPWRDVWAGAATTALLFVIGKILIGWYLERSQVGSDWGASAVSVIGALVWVYYSSLIVLFGAEFTQVWASHFGHGIKPAPGSVRAVRETRHVRHGSATPRMS